jgi:hypothetical protein
MASSSIFLSNLLLLFSVLMCLLLLSAEEEIATCFLLEGWFVLSLHAESERGFVAVWNIGFYTTVCC